MNRLLLFLAFLSILSIKANAQQYSIKNYGITEGLGQSQVHAMVQDSLGYLWIGTLGGGVSRFNGSTFQNYTRKDGLASNFVLSLSITEKGSLLVGTNKGLSRILPDTIYSHTTNSPLDSLIIEDINLPYIATSKGVFTYKNNVVGKLTTESNRCSKETHQILQDSSTIWAATHYGLLVVNDSSVTCQTDLNRVHNNYFTSIIKDKNGNIWIGSLGGGLTKIDQEGTLTNFSKSNGLKSYDISCLFEDSKHNIWIGSRGQGVSKYNGKEFIQITQKNGLANDFVNSITEDNLGNIWFGTSNGLSKYEGDKYILYDKSSNIPNGGAYVTYQTTDSTYWTGNLGGGLYRFKNGKGKLFDHKNGFTSARVKVLYQDKDSVLWIGTDSKGLFTYENGKFKNKGIGNQWVRDIQPYSDSILYISTLGNGLIKLTNNTKNQIHIKKGKGNRINKLAIDSVVWLATDKGVYYYDHDSVYHFNLIPQERITSLAKGENGTLYFGNIGNGIYVLNNNKVTQITSNQGLSSDNIYALYAEENKLWVGTEKGIDELIIDPDGIITSITKHTLKEGFLGIEILRNSIYKDFNNDYWFGTVGGLTKYTPTTETKTSIPHLRMKSIELFYEPQLLNNQQLIVNSFKYDQNHFTFRFNGIDLSTPNLLYRWRLIGSDTIWSIPTTQNFITYSNLPTGSFTLEVQTIGNSKTWSKTLKQHIIIRQPYWQTYWFKLLIVITSLLLLLISILMIIKHINKKNRLNNEQQRTKLKMVELEQQALRLQMNPHFLFNSLNAIKGAVAQKQTKEAKKAIDQFAKLMRSMLENTQEGFIQLSKEIILIEQYLSLERLNHSFEFVTENNTPENCYIPAMMIQPLVENAVLHGISPLNDSGKIEVSFTTINKSLLLCKIEDNGIGRTASQRAKNNSVHQQESKAMSIITSRLELIKQGDNNIRLEIVDKPNEEGTIVNLYLPIKHSK